MSVSNTGKKVFGTLTQIFVDTGVATGSTKANDPNDPDFVPPVIDLVDCPPPAPVAPLVNKIHITIVNNTTQSIGWNNLIIRPESIADPAQAYYKNVNFTILPGVSFAAPAVDQVDDLTRISFGVVGLSLKIRTNVDIKYKASDEGTYTDVYDVDVSELTAVNASFSTLRVDSSSATNEVLITLTENPAPPIPSNPPPVVAMGPNQIIVLPITSSTINATASSPSGVIASVLWQQIGGPSTAVIQTPSGILTNITNLFNAGVYTFKFTAIDTLNQSSQGTLTITVAPNPNGLVNMLVDPAMADNTFKINQITLYNQLSPGNAPITLLPSSIDKVDGVVLKTPLKGTYRMLVDIAGATGGTKSLVVVWGVNSFSINLPEAGLYMVDDVVVDDGGNGVLVTYGAGVVAAPDLTIVWAKLTTGGTTTHNQNVLPNGMITTEDGDISVAFFSDDAGTIPSTFVGKVRAQVTITDNITTNVAVTQSQTTVNPAAASVIIDTLQRYKFFDYNQLVPLVQDDSYVYILLPEQGYLIIP